LQNLINRIQIMQKSNHFQMTTLPVLKEERELITEEAYKEFWKNNEVVINQNFERNAYLALLMQELDEDRKLDKRRWDVDEERTLLELHEKNTPEELILARFPDRSEKEVRKKLAYLMKRKTQSS
jgi:hypothetical protein